MRALHRFAFTSAVETTTLVAPDPSSLLTNAPATLDGLLFPLLSLTLDGGRRVPLLYMEMYGREADGSPLPLRAGADGDRYALEPASLDRLRAFHAELGLSPTVAPQSWLRRHLGWLEVELPTLGSMPQATRHERETAWFDLVNAALRADPSDAARLFRGAGCAYQGPAPVWLQDDQTPLDSAGAPMRFVAQVDASLLTDEAADSCNYLFRSDDWSELAQVTQLS